MESPHAAESAGSGSTIRVARLAADILAGLSAVLRPRADHDGGTATYGPGEQVDGIAVTAGPHGWELMLTVDVDASTIPGRFDDMSELTSWVRRALVRGLTEEGVGAIYRVDFEIVDVVAGLEQYE